MLEALLKHQPKHLLEQCLKRSAQASAQLRARALLEGDRIGDRGILTGDLDAAGLSKRPADASAVHHAAPSADAWAAVPGWRYPAPPAPNLPHGSLRLLRGLAFAARGDADTPPGAVESLRRQKPRPLASQIFTSANLEVGGYARAVLEQCPGSPERRGSFEGGG